MQRFIFFTIPLHPFFNLVNFLLPLHQKQEEQTKRKREQQEDKKPKGGKGKDKNKKANKEQTKQATKEKKKHTTLPKPGIALSKRRKLNSPRSTSSTQTQVVSSHTFAVYLFNFLKIIERSIGVRGH